MSPLLEQLKATATGLSAPERAELAHYLLETLEPAEEGVAEAWRTELARRMADIRSGKVVGKPVEQVLARLRELYP
jgi:putative addiction module component (TIGR02574 family)